MGTLISRGQWIESSFVTAKITTLAGSVGIDRYTRQASVNIKPPFLVQAKGAIKTVVFHLPLEKRRRENSVGNMAPLRNDR